MELNLKEGEEEVRQVRFENSKIFFVKVNLYSVGA